MLLRKKQNKKTLLIKIGTNKILKFYDTFQINKIRTNTEREFWVCGF